MRLPSRTLVFPLLVCSLVALGFAHVDVVGFHRGVWKRDRYGGRCAAQSVTHGWPTPFASHEEYCSVDRTDWPYEFHRPPFFDQVNPRNWTSFRISSVRALAYDILFQVCVIAITGVAIVRLTRRLCAGCGLSAADKLLFLVALLTAAAFIPLGKNCVLVADLYTALRDLPPFTCVAVSLAIACAAGLVFSMARRFITRRHAENTRLSQRLSHMPVFTILACLLVAVAFARIDVLGSPRDSNAEEVYLNFGTASAFGFCHGWPAPFASHVHRNTKATIDATPYEDEGWCPSPPPTFLDQIDLSQWDTPRLDSVRAAILDLVLQAALIAVTGVMIFRFEQRRWFPLQFSISDLLSLTATVGMVLGLLSLDKLPLPLLIQGGYMPLHALPLFDAAMTVLAIACAVGLIVSTATARLGSKRTGEAE